MKIKKHKCSVCKKKFPRTNKYFNKNVSRKADGLDYICKWCTSERGSKWYKNNRDRVNKRRLFRILIRKESNLCIRCDKQRLNNNVQYCEEHWFRIIAQNNLGSMKRWYELKELAEKQNYKCALTGINLIPGINMTVDHIIPVTRNDNLKHNIDNIQFVAYSVNVFKNYMTNDELFKICKLIYEKHELNKIIFTDAIKEYYLNTVPARRKAK